MSHQNGALSCPDQDNFAGPTPTCDGVDGHIKIKTNCVAGRSPANLLFCEDNIIIVLVNSQ